MRNVELGIKIPRIYAEQAFEKTGKAQRTIPIAISIPIYREPEGGHSILAIFLNKPRKAKKDLMAFSRRSGYVDLTFTCICSCLWCRMKWTCRMLNGVRLTRSFLYTKKMMSFAVRPDGPSDLKLFQTTRKSFSITTTAKTTKTVTRVEDFAVRPGGLTD